MKLWIKKFKSVFVAAIIIVTITQEAKAQYEYTQAWSTTQKVWLTGVVNSNMMKDNLKREERNRSKSLSSKSEIKSAGDINSLSFTSSDALRQKVIQNVSTEFANGNAKRAQIIKNSLIKNNAIEGFNAMLNKYDFKPSNMADVFSAYVIFSWQIVSGDDAGKHIKGAIKYRNAIRKAMLTNDKISLLDNAKRQQVCESMALYTMMGIAATKNSRDIKTLQGIRAITQKLTGVDVANYYLTDDGFSSK